MEAGPRHIPYTTHPCFRVLQSCFFHFHTDSYSNVLVLVLVLLLNSASMR